MRKRRLRPGQQLWALLCKNWLRKLRMRRETLLLSSNLHQVHDAPEMSVVDLGRVDNFNDSNYIIVFAPDSETTHEIMNKVASAPFMKGRMIVACPDEKTMHELDFNYSIDAVRVIFKDTFSYHLKFSWGQRIPKTREHKDHSAPCEPVNNKMICENSVFWEKGFIAFQAAINAGIIEDDNKPLRDGNADVGHWFKYEDAAFYRPRRINVTQERQYLTALMAMMGLRESAFWKGLSWGLMYAGFILVVATLMSLIVKSAQVVVLTGFMVVFLLFLLYGLSLITLSFLMSVLLKKPFLTGLAVFLLTVFWGSLGFTALYKHLPAFMEWTLCFLSPFAFTTGMAQLIHLDYDMNSNVDLHSPDNSYLIMATLFMLILDSLLYLALALYFDKITLNKYGHQRSPLFFLKSSYWFQRRGANHVVLEDEIDSDASPSDSLEPVSPEFQGKEAIRIKNLKKEYSGKHGKVEALRVLTHIYIVRNCRLWKVQNGYSSTEYNISETMSGLGFDIYEGQITALLGHSGAGKTTLINILSGLSPPTTGSVTIYNQTVSEMEDSDAVIKLTGVCPQSNVQCGFLTVRENLRLFAKIKGILPHEVEQEVRQVLRDLEMENIQDVLAQNLSGGQKRKLTFGIAILGDPQVLLLDEPTAGLDPLSRHRIWNLLKERRLDRVIVFSTQFMDEADILADRKVFISSGRLRCAGSSLFLKKKWGIGYHLSLHLNETCDPESITSLVQKHIPDARLTAQSQERLVYILPLERTNKFPDLYRDLDRCSSQGIEDYGVSMTTLNEVFLRLEGKSMVDDSDVGICGRSQSDGAKDAESLVELERVLSLDSSGSSVSGMALWRQQLCAVAKIRFFKLKNERKSLMTVLLLFGISFVPQLLEHLVYKAYHKSYSWGLSPSMYFLSSGQPPQDPLTHLLVINRTGSSIDDFVRSLRQQGIALDIDGLGTRNGTEEALYNGAITVLGDKKDRRFSIACNAKRLNCFPVLMDVISNGLLGTLNSSERIQTDRSTVFEEHMVYEYGFMSNTFFWIPVAASLTPYVAMGSISDHKKKVLSQLWTSGLYPSAYWCGQAVVDIPIYFLILLLMQIMDGVFSSEEIMSVVESLLIQYPMKNSGVWSFFFLIVTIFFMVATDINDYGFLGLLLCTLLVPPFTLIGSLLIFSEVSYDSVDYLGASESQLVFLALLIALPSLSPFLFRSAMSGKIPQEEVTESGPCVQEFLQGAVVLFQTQKSLEKRMKMSNGKSENNGCRDYPADGRAKPVIIASCLRKEYSGKRKGCFSKTKKKIATRNISFCVKKESYDLCHTYLLKECEVLGLLGHNGAGKSTTISMITGDTMPTAGQVFLKGSIGGAALGFLGYCPQENVLWPALTVKEHLELYAAVKGLKKKDAEITITRLVNALKLQDHLKALVKTLSEGLKRKLCFVLSILGNPSVVLLDEPSTGMDPEGQQQMWQAIRATFTNTERGALLTTHYMAEAEAVCDRVAIMVSGRLRCIGSIQHLKSKFGKDYLLEMKVKAPMQVESLNMEIMRLFPQAARQEREYTHQGCDLEAQCSSFSPLRRYSSLMVYKLPVEDVRPLSEAFFKLERLKENFDLEEYSLSQSTLEQVFLELSKEQELDDFDEEANSSVKWKLLPQEEL
ncbi:ATP-binding cassette sub-family A member 9 [Apodemus speciosus]|uniref:ATP-binding cassette sub-family A member 9 n=1 Tax=Apodemus speciosus TaxID=105296 RepID=A0ABQ0FCM8_APOSI